LHQEKPAAKVAQNPEKPGKESALEKSAKKKPIDKTEKPSYSVRRETLASLTEQERSLVEKLQGEMLVDDLIAASALPAGQVLAMLTMLEIRGIVARLPGKRVRLCYEME
jgi:predicted Rossmann fold nucleotide-binding protein DprA/Smf involved in DNA uptake